MNRPNEVSTSDVTPAGTWEQDAAKRALDELFSLTSQYRTSEAYQQLLQFVTRFRSYSPFNAMLVHIQMPGAEFIAPPHNVAAQGSEVSLGHIFQDLLLQRQLRHQPLQASIFLLQFLQPFRLIQLQSAVFLPPPVVGLGVDPGFLAGLRRGLPVRHLHFDLPPARLQSVPPCTS